MRRPEETLIGEGAAIEGGARTNFTGQIPKVLAAVAISAGMAIGLSAPAMAQSNDELMRRIEALESQLGKMQGMKQELESLKSELIRTQATATKMELEFANLNLLATDWLTFTTGRLLSPIGDFQQHLHTA